LLPVPDITLEHNEFLLINHLNEKCINKFEFYSIQLLGYFVIFASYCYVIYCTLNLQKAYHMF